MPVRDWLASNPVWLSIKSVEEDIDTDLTELLDPGESEAIQLALMMTPDFVLMDERLGRREAQRRGLNVIGALGILQQGNRLGHLRDPIKVLEQLSACGFRVSTRLVREFKSSLTA